MKIASMSSGAMPFAVVLDDDRAATFGRRRSGEVTMTLAVGRFIAGVDGVGDDVAGSLDRSASGSNISEGMFARGSPDELDASFLGAAVPSGRPPRRRPG